MERTTLGPVEQFRDDSGAWKIGQRLLDSGGWNLRGWGKSHLVAFRLYDTGQIVLVDESRLEPNVPSKPAVGVDFGTGADVGMTSTFAVDDSGKVEIVDELANCGLTEIDLVDPGDN